MSLFGDDYESNSSGTRSSLFGDPEPTPRSSLATTATVRSAVSSSADRLFDNNDSDPWTLPVPRVSQKPTLSSLLDNVVLPQVYTDSFNAERASNGGSGDGFLTVENVRHLVDKAGLSNDPRGDRIVELIIRNKPDNRIDPGTWAVALALIGLAQEGDEDLNLDSVDSRRFSLPVPKVKFNVQPAQTTTTTTTTLSSSRPSRFSKQIKQAVPSAIASAPIRQSYSSLRAQSKQASVPPLTIPAEIPTTAVDPPSPSSPPGISVGPDPWASAAPVKNNTASAYSQSSYNNTSTTNDYSSASNYNSNTYSSNAYSSNNKYSSSQNNYNRNSNGNGNGNGNGNNYNNNFNDQDDEDDYIPPAQTYTANKYVSSNEYNPNYSSVLGADYNDLTRTTRSSLVIPTDPIVVQQEQEVVEDDDSDAEEDESGEVKPRTYVPNFPYTRTQPYYDAHEGDKIRVTIIPEKEGVFMFRHVNYLLEGASSPNGDGTVARGGYRVVRRYSDFVWLLNCLLKRYPFRILPLLPPKRFAVNGHYLSSDDFFLERRRRGLSRFINEIAKHPVLNKEQLVIMFLTVPTELSVWRKQAQVNVEDEFTGRALPDGLIASWDQAEIEKWEEVKKGVKTEAELYTHLCLLIDRMEKRQESVAADHQRFAQSLNTLQEVTQQTYSVDTNDLSLINDGIKNVSRYLNNAQALLEDESRGWEIGVLEDFKRHRDNLISIKELFDRMEKLNVNQIPYLERRIQNNETRLKSMKDRSDFKQSDLDRVNNNIHRDREAIQDQITRSWLIKECMRDELTYFQQTKYSVAKLFQDYAQERLKYAELFAENWRVLQNEISEIPTQAS
ncbi:hypothetical protein V1514DRAFT_352046 [Lipomyces japonicus]|uniref:uncharacterized protein n=1 Tax=Lipomyces japonicus TaxID=56871 RepID=UPI0034CFAA76